MPKVGMHAVRRDQLIRATVEVIRDHGFADATIARISRRAGLSGGIIAHYFGGKNELLVASMRWLLRELQAETGQRLRDADSPPQRIRAIIEASFDAEQFKPGVPQVWLAFYAQIPHEPELTRLHRVYMRRLQSNLLHAFAQLIPRPAAVDAAEGMASMIDGIYVRAALVERPLDTGRAHRLMNEYLEMLLGRHDDGFDRRDPSPPPMETSS